MALFAHNKGNYDPVTTAAIAAASQKQASVPMSVTTGNVYKVFLSFGTTQYNANPAYTQLSVNANSFVILDAPSSVIIKSDIFPDQVFQERTGQAFTQNFTFLQLKPNILTADPYAWNAESTPVSTYINGITVTIWAGHTSESGYIDNRTQPSRNSFELTVPAYNLNGPGNYQTIAGNTLGVFNLAPQAGLLTGQTPDTYYNLNFAQFTLKDLIISNIDSANTIILTDSYKNYMMAIGPGQTVRIPYPINIAYNPAGNAFGFPDSPASYNIFNPNSASVNFISSVVIWTNSLDYSIPV